MMEIAPNPLPSFAKEGVTAVTGDFFCTLLEITRHAE